MTSGVSPRKIDESWVESKLRSANDSTECVQTLSLWALNHKSEHEQIVNIWLKVFKSADESQMVVLIYLCNDILQTCKRRNAVMFKESFKKALLEAVHFIKAEKAINSFKKILKVWSERNVFDEKYVEELNSLAFGNSSSKTNNDKQLKSKLSDSKMSKSQENNNNNKSNKSNNDDDGSTNNSNENDNGVNVSKMTTTTTTTTISRSKKLALATSDFDFKKLIKMMSQDSKHSVKLKATLEKSSQYLYNIDEVTSENDPEKQKSYLMNKSDEINSICQASSQLSDQIKEKGLLISHVELALSVYKEQNKDAKLVASAYKNFGSRVQTLSKKLQERRQLLMLSEQSKDDDEDDEEDDNNHVDYYLDDVGRDKEMRNEIATGDVNYEVKLINSGSAVLDKDNSNLNVASATASSYCSGAVYGDKMMKPTSHHLIINDEDIMDIGKEIENDDDDLLFNQLFTGEMNDNNDDDDLKFATNEKRDDKRGGAAVRRRASLDERLKMIEMGGLSSNFEEGSEPPAAKNLKFSTSLTGYELDMEYKQSINNTSSSSNNNNNNMTRDMEYDGRATPVLDEHSPTQSSSTSSSLLTMTSSNLMIAPSSSSKPESKSHHQSRLEELFLNFTKASGKILKGRSKASFDDEASSDHSVHHHHRNKSKHQKHDDAKEYKRRDDYDANDDDYGHHHSHHRHKSRDKRDSESRYSRRTDELKSNERYKEKETSKHKSRKDESRHREDSGKYDGDDDDDRSPPPPPPVRVTTASTSVTNQSIIFPTDGHSLVSATPSIPFPYYTQQLPISVSSSSNIITNQGVYQAVNTQDGISQLQAVPSNVDNSQYMYEEVVYLFTEEDDSVGQLQQIGQLPMQQQPQPQAQHLFQGGSSNNPGNIIVASSTDNLYGDRYLYHSIIKSDNNVVLIPSQLPQQQQQQQQLQQQQQFALPLTVHPQQSQPQMILQPQQPAVQPVPQYVPINVPPPVQQAPPFHHQQVIAQQQQQPYSLPPPSLPPPAIPPRTNLPPPPFVFTQQPPPPLPQALVPAPFYAPPQLKHEVTVPQPPQPSPYSFASNSISVISPLSSSSSSTYLPADPVMKVGLKLASDLSVRPPPTMPAMIRRPSNLTTITLTEPDDALNYEEGVNLYGSGDVLRKSGTVYCKALNPSMFSSCVYSSRSVSKSLSYSEIERQKVNKGVVQPLINNNSGTLTAIKPSPQQQQQQQTFIPSSNLVLLSNNKSNIAAAGKSSINLQSGYIGVRPGIVSTSTSATSTFNPTFTNTIISRAAPPKAAPTVCTAVANVPLTFSAAGAVLTSAGNNMPSLSTAATTTATFVSNPMSLVTTCVNDVINNTKTLPDSSSTTMKTSSSSLQLENRCIIPAQEPDSTGLPDTNYNSSDSSDLEDFPDAITFTAPLAVVNSNPPLNVRPSFIQKQFGGIKNASMTQSPDIPSNPSRGPSPSPRVPLNFLSPSNVSAIATRAVDILMRVPRAPLLRGPPQPMFRGPVSRLPAPPHQPIFPSFSMPSSIRRPRF